MEDARERRRRRAEYLKRSKQVEEIDGMNPSTILESKRELRKIRNRESATLSRKRKNEEVSMLHTQVEDLQAEVLQLRKRLAMYEREPIDARTCIKEEGNGYLRKYYTSNIVIANNSRRCHNEPAVEIFNKAGVKLQINNNVKSNNNSRINQYPSSPSSVSDHNCDGPDHDHDGGSTTSETNSNVSQQQYQYHDNNNDFNDKTYNGYNGYYDEGHTFGDDGSYGLLQPPLADDYSNNNDVNEDYLDNNLLDLLFSDDESD